MILETYVLLRKTGFKTYVTVRLRRARIKTMWSFLPGLEAEGGDRCHIPGGHSEIPKSETIPSPTLK